MRMETTRPSPSHRHNQLSQQEPEPEPEASKQVHNASSKVNLVVHKMLLPLLDTPLRTHVVFDAETDQAELDLMEQVDRNNPKMLDDPTSFVQHIQRIMFRYKSYAAGYSPVSRAGDVT